MFKIKIMFIFITIIIVYPQVAFAQRGCCSRHGGVVGCSSSGKQICGDGTLSPTCRCAPNPPINYDYMGDSNNENNSYYTSSLGETNYSNTLEKTKINEEKEPSFSDIFIKAGIIVLIGYILYKLRKHKNNYSKIDKL